MRVWCEPPRGPRGGRIMRGHAREVDESTTDEIAVLVELERRGFTFRAHLSTGIVTATAREIARECRVEIPEAVATEPEVTHLSGNRKRRKFSGEVEFRRSSRIRVPIASGSGGYRMVTGYSRGHNESSLTKATARLVANAEGKRAVFSEREWPHPDAPKKSRRTMIEKALSEEQRTALREIWEAVQRAAPHTIDRLRTVSDAMSMLENEAVGACVEMAESRVDGSHYDAERSAKATKRARQVGLGILWLKLQAEGK